MLTMNDSRLQLSLKKRPMKLSTLSSLMMAAVLMTVILSVHLLYYIQIDNFTRSHLKDKAMAVARTLADSPEIQQALTRPDGSTIIQPIAQATRKRNDLLFVVVTGGAHSGRQPGDSAGPDAARRKHHHSTDRAGNAKT